MIHFCLLLCMLFGKAATSLSWMSTTPFQAPFLETVFSLLRCLKTLIWKSFVDKCKHSFRLSSRFPWLAILSVSQNHTFAVALLFFVLDRFSCNPGGLWTHFVAMSDFGFLIPVCLHEIWALRCVSLHQICAMLEDGAQSSVCATQSLCYLSGISLSLAIRSTLRPL